MGYSLPAIRVHVRVASEAAAARVFLGRRP